MEHRQIILIIALVVLFFGFGCDDKPEPNPDKNDWDLPPNIALKISFIDSSSFLRRIPEKLQSHITGEYLSSMVYYFDDQNNMVYDEFTIANRTNGEYPYFKLSLGGTDVRFAYLSIGGKTWYIDWPNGQTDTLYANYRSDPKGPNDCSCSEPLVELTLNGKPYIEKSNYDINGVYVFE